MSSRFSGYDSETVGFDSMSKVKKTEVNMSTQTNFDETGTASQTNLSKDCGSLVTPEEVHAEEDILEEYPPPGLNEFLRKVVPTMLEQLDQDAKESWCDTSDSDEDDVIEATVFQELKVKNDTRTGSGDCQPKILGVSWSSTGKSLAISIGQSQHEEWCTHDGLIRIYMVKRSEQDRLVHQLDIAQKTCVTVVKYHPSVAALLAYGTTSGEVVLCDLRTTNTDDGCVLTSPSDCHGSKRVTALQWADAPLTNSYLVAQISKSGKRRGASDQVLVSSGSDGTLNVWQVNANLKIFEHVITYKINSPRDGDVADITCFDFIKVFPLRPSEERVKDDIFAVGTKSGEIFLCRTKTDEIKSFVDELNPVYGVVDGHTSCVMDLAFSFQKPGVFASISMDSDLRVYDVTQNASLKVLCLDVPISCLAWLPNNPCIAILGLSTPDKQVLKVYNVSSGHPVKVAGLIGNAGVCAMAINQTGTCRIAAGDGEGIVRIYDLPSRRIRLTPDDLEF